MPTIGRDSSVRRFDLGQTCPASHVPIPTVRRSGMMSRAARSALPAISLARRGTVSADLNEWGSACRATGTSPAPNRDPPASHRGAAPCARYSPRGVRLPISRVALLRRPSSPRRAPQRRRSLRSPGGVAASKTASARWWWIGHGRMDSEMAALPSRTAERDRAPTNSSRVLSRVLRQSSKSLSDLDPSATRGTRVSEQLGARWSSPGARKGAHPRPRCGDGA